MRYLPALLLVVLVGLCASVHGRVDERRAQIPAAEDLMVLPPPGYLRPMSVGYREALADLVWIRALIFAGENLGSSQGALVERYVEGITTLAPRFVRPYVWGGITSIYGGSAAVDRAMVERSIAIYSRGLDQFPDNHELLYARGMLRTHQVGSTPGYSEQERAESFARGVADIRRAAAHGADPLVRRYAATLVADGATDRLAITFLESQLAQTDDEDHRRLLRRKLGELSGRESVARIEAIRDRFEGRRTAAAPYVPDALWAVIEVPPSEP